MVDDEEKIDETTADVTAETESIEEESNAEATELPQEDGGGEGATPEEEASSRPTVVCGNWKMYKNINEAVAFVEELLPLVADTSNKVLLAVPFTSIREASNACQSSNVVIGAQNMHDATEGAFTGEIAARMLLDAGAQFVVLGHSERRHIFNENNSFINRKVLKALSDGLQPILCVGETLSQREGGNTETVIKEQLEHCLADVTADKLTDLIVAYEPVWAIGTGLTATASQAQEVHAFIRRQIASECGDGAAARVPILYGGSVKTDNALLLMSEADIDGLLVGGASLAVETFAAIANVKKSLLSQEKV